MWFSSNDCQLKLELPGIFSTNGKLILEYITFSENPINLNTLKDRDLN